MNDLLVVIAAAGEGKRFGGDIPKQYIKLNGMSVIESSVRPFINSKNVSKILIAISKNDSQIKNQDFFINQKKLSLFLVAILGRRLCLMLLCMQMKHIDM
mgnify:CR=1 FL=1